MKHPYIAPCLCVHAIRSSIYVLQASTVDVNFNVNTNDPPPDKPITEFYARKQRSILDDEW